MNLIMLLPFFLLFGMALLNGTGSLGSFPIQIGATVPTAGGVTQADPTLIVTGIVAQWQPGIQSRAIRRQ